MAFDKKAEERDRLRAEERAKRNLIASRNFLDVIASSMLIGKPVAWHMTDDGRAYCKLVDVRPVVQRAARTPAEPKPKAAKADRPTPPIDPKVAAEAQARKLTPESIETRHRVAALFTNTWTGR